MTRPFSNYFRPLFRGESWCSFFHMQIDFHSLEIKLIFLWMKIVLHMKESAARLASKKKPKVICNCLLTLSYLLFSLWTSRSFWPDVSGGNLSFRKHYPWHVEIFTNAVSPCSCVLVKTEFWSKTNKNRVARLLSLSSCEQAQTCRKDVLLLFYGYLAFFPA